MTRPLNNDIVQGQQSWDGDLRDNLKSLFKTPLPVPNGEYELSNGSTEGSAYTSSAGLPSATLFDGCLAAVNQSGTWSLWTSNGTSWRRLVSSNNTDINALVDNSGGSSGGDTISAVTTVGEAADGIATLAAKVNAIISALGLDL